MHTPVEPNALRAWQQLLGDDRVISEPDALRSSATATFATTQQVLLILEPGNRQEVQECVRIANRFLIPLYPVSTGLNWGYGSTVPVTSGCVILSLRRLDQITEYSDKLGYATIEPGVTQRQLSDFLATQGNLFWMDATGASESCSIIGNTIERGFGHTPYGDHFSQVCALEVVLPTGECIHTGFGRFDNALATPVYRWGVGPYLDGLFTQSNLGIVTQMTVWLMPAPEYFQAYYFSVENNGDLGDILEALRPLRLAGNINSAVHIANDYRVLSSIQQYPWEAAQGQTPLPEELLTDMGRQWDFGAWTGSGALYGTRQQVAHTRRAIRRAFKRRRVKKLRFIDDRIMDFAEKYQTPLKRLTGKNFPEMLKLASPVHNMMKGIPTNRIIASTYWRKKSPVPIDMDPGRDRCGLMWCAPIAPIDGKSALRMAEIVSEIVVLHGFEPAMTITLLTKRSMDNVISISYDREIEGQDQRAMACFDELLNALVKEGFYPYRLGVNSMHSLPRPLDDYPAFLKTIKTALDPNRILAPGRYE